MVIFSHMFCYMQSAKELLLYIVFIINFMKWQDPSESLGYCFNLLFIAMQGFRTQMNRKNVLHCNSLQYFLIVDYCTSTQKE